MSERLNTQDLIDLLVNRQGLDRKQAESFVKEFFLLIEEGLQKDKLVKIKGFGTFKLIQVESRESINVNTGERIEIQGHTKVSFTPDATLRDIINKPFSHFETVVLNEGVTFEDTIEEQEPAEQESSEQELIEQKSSEQELKLEQEQGQEPRLERETDIVTPEVVIPTVASAEEINVEEVVPEEAIIEETVIEETVIEEAPATPDTHIETEEQQENPESIEETKEEKASSSNKILIIVIILTTLLCGLLLFFTYYSDIFPEKKKPAPVETVSQPVTPVTDSVAVDSVEEKATPVPEEKETEKPIADNAAKQNNNPIPFSKIPVNPDSTSYEIIGTKASHTIKEGETLTRISYQYYGTKDLWPYLVKHNRAVIKKADAVPLGTTINIPDLKKKGF